MKKTLTAAAATALLATGALAETHASESSRLSARFWALCCKATSKMRVA
jgi:hypothetical protein